MVVPEPSHSSSEIENQKQRSEAKCRDLKELKKLKNKYKSIIKYNKKVWAKTENANKKPYIMNILRSQSHANHWLSADCIRALRLIAATVAAQFIASVIDAWLFSMLLQCLKVFFFYFACLNQK